MKTLIIIFCLIYFTSCNRCDNSAATKLYITDKTKQYFANYSEGSYWVFENYADSNDIDTLVLINKSFGTTPRYAEKCIEYNDEYINYNLVSKISKDTLSANVSTNNNIDGFNLGGKYHSLQISCGFTTTKSTGDLWVNTTFGDVLQTYNSYSVLSKQYNDVFAMTFVQLSQSYHDRAPTYYYCRNIGLIEFIIYDEISSSKRTYCLKNYLIR